MTIEHHPGSKQGSFSAVVNSIPCGELVYTHAGAGKVIIEHTEVYTVAEGKGVGRALVTAAVEWARAEHLKLVPRCPFASLLFKRIPEWADVLASGMTSI